MDRTTPYCPGPGDIVRTFAGHSHDPQAPDCASDDVTADVINDVRDFLAMAEIAATKGDLAKAMQALAEALASLEELIGVEQ